jgi:hypothetical protein
MDDTNEKLTQNVDSDRNSKLLNGNTDENELVNIHSLTNIVNLEKDEKLDFENSSLFLTNGEQKETNINVENKKEEATNSQNKQEQETQQIQSTKTRIIPNAPNWYCFKISDSSSNGLFCFGAKNSIFVCDCLSGYFFAPLSSGRTFIRSI